jgi:hypothetical protein
MKAIPYTTKTGLKQFKPQLTERAIEKAMFDHNGEGMCLACGEEPDYADPDTRKATCEFCGKPKVYGLQELLMMGLVSIK